MSAATSRVPTLLGDDGSASIATAVMISHHGFRRDLTHFAAALRRLQREPGASLEVQPLQNEWVHFHNTLHGHHEAEDQRLFPGLLGQHAQLETVIARLTADHRQIDPILERGNAAFAGLSVAHADPAVAVVDELTRLLWPHLALEEETLIPHMRDWKEFPAPPDPAELDLIANGFAWGFDGIAPDVLEKVLAMLPPALIEKLPAARASFAARRLRVWGPAQPATTRTPLPAGS
ncbi:MAG TPA: hemerythrin domain-containing protein [Polyangia bacterium]